jgi:predicted  nucleic acid-binding Zn-ribbon protein
MAEGIFGASSSTYLGVFGSVMAFLGTILATKLRLAFKKQEKQEADLKASEEKRILEYKSYIEENFEVLWKRIDEIREDITELQKEISYISGRFEDLQKAHFAIIYHPSGGHK